LPATTNLVAILAGFQGGVADATLDEQALAGAGIVLAVEARMPYLSLLMKLACLILAHAGGPVLARTLPIYHTAGWDVFVHLDPKADRKAYIAALGDTADLCRFVDHPIPVFWAGYTMIRATLLLIETARMAGQFDRFLLLSDDAMPIFPPDFLNAQLAAQDDMMTAEVQGPGSKNYQDYQEFFFLDHPTTAVRNGIPRNGKIDEKLQAAFLDIIGLKTVGKKALTLYYGSQFWCLTSETVDFIVRTIQSDRHLAKSFEYTAFSDELLFQSIIGNWKYAGGRNDSPVYADFYSDPGKTEVFRAVRELPYDLHRNHLFLRKIAPSATGFLDQMAVFLAEGRTIHGASAEQPFLSPETDPAGRPRMRQTFGLAAPDDMPANRSWHAKERYLRQLYRWTGADHIEWTVNIAAPAPERICFFVPVVISKPHFLENCRLKFYGQERRMTYTRYSLIAEFQQCDFRGGEATVTLLTPPPVEAYPVKDPRRVGLGIAVGNDIASSRPLGA